MKGENTIELVQERWMTVTEMGNLLGLKRTERYYLLHKNNFRTVQRFGKTWVDIDSFEAWYANQVRYHKVEGEEPGRELKEHSYSVRDIAKILGLSEARAYNVLNEQHIETVEVDGWRRVPKDVFDRWYAGQEHYRSPEDRNREKDLVAASATMPELARMLGITRGDVYRILKDKRYRDLFEVITVAGRKRITRKSIERFLAAQAKYRPVSDYEETVFLTPREAAGTAGVSRTLIDRWAQEGHFHEYRCGNVIRIPQTEFLRWLEKWKSERGD